MARPYRTLEQLKEYILNNIIIDNNNCWLWQRNCYRNGYASICFNAKATLGHRLSWLIFNNSLDENICVLHKCDVRNCVNPEHLFLGTNQDNSDDMWKKNRGASGKRHGLVKNPSAAARGAQMPQTKINEQIVRSVRIDWQTNNFTQLELAIKYKLKRQHIEKIVNRRIWKHVK